jgi:hypothetical protein
MQNSKILSFYFGSDSNKENDASSTLRKKASCQASKDGLIGGGQHIISGQKRQRTDRNKCIEM